MMRGLLSLLLVCAVVLASFTGEAGAGAPPGHADAPPAQRATCVPAGQCCRICDAGQACGSSCISRAKVCRKGRGCACDAAEVCP